MHLGRAKPSLTLFALWKQRPKTLESSAPSQKQTVQWRQQQNWYRKGKRNECELHQRSTLERIIGEKCPRTSERILIPESTIQRMPHVLRLENAFDWTETFDGRFVFCGIPHYVNFKFVCGNGGMQMRSLRETYHFVQAQLKCIQKRHMVMINILEGDACHRAHGHFQRCIATLPEEYKARIYVGDMAGFADWWAASKN